MSDLSANFSDALARFVVGFDSRRLEPEDLRQISRAILDTVAVAVAAHDETAARIALDYARALTGPPLARAWLEPQGARLDPEAAALANGVAAHVLDYDDVTEPLRGHPSVALLPALLALGEAHDASGLELAAAFTVGFELVCRLARTMVDDHYARGWHSTASIGTLAAAAACARLLGLDERGVRDSIGLALAQTGGSRANFGTMAKSFQAGQCGAAAVRAARLAARGMTAAPDPIGGPFGYMALYANGEDLAPEFEGFAQAGALELRASGFEIKKYPMCYATHRVIDGLLGLRAAHRLSLDAVNRVEILGSPRAFVPLIHPRPQTGLEGKFSMHYAVAAALADGQVSLASFTDESVLRPAIQHFFPRVELAEASGALMPRWAQISVHLSDGRVLRERVDTLRGSAQAPLSDAELRSKIDDCFAWAGREQAADAFCRQAARLDRISVRELVDALGSSMRAQRQLRAAIRS